MEELEYVQEIGSQLGITKDQVMAIKDVQFHLWQLKSTPSDSDAFKAMLKECASNLAAAGVPIAAIAGSGSVFLITQLAPHRPPWTHRLVHRYQSVHGTQQHPVPEGPFAA